MWGRSNLRQVDVATGTVLRALPLPDARVFAEGVAANPANASEILQLTYQSGRAFRYGLGDDPGGLARRDGEVDTTLRDGWGLTATAEHFVATDGHSAALHFLDPATYRPVRSVPASDGFGRPIQMLNELEWIEGEVWANVYTGHCLVALDPATGRATKWVVGVDPLLRGPPHSGAGARGEVLNSIAYDPASGRLWVTGKDWARLFEVRLAEQSALGIRSSRHLFDRRCIVR